MKSNLIRGILLGSIALLGSNSFSVVAHAAELPCGNIIAPKEWTQPESGTEINPIEDCIDPFGVSLGISSPYILSVDGEEVSEKERVVVSDAGTSNYFLSGTPILDSARGFFFLHDKDDYRLINTESADPNESDFRTFAHFFFSPETDIEPYVHAILAGGPWDYELDEDLFWSFQNEFYNQFVEEPVKLLPGTYTLVIKDSKFQLTRGFLEHLFDALVPTAYADEHSEYIFAITFTLTAEAVNQVDPLLFEYLPILRTHPDEDFFPMNVEAFIGASALWDDRGVFPDEVVTPYDSENPITIDDLVSFDDSDNLYLAFSDPENAKSLDVAAALFKYKELVNEDIAQTTVYVRKMEDSYEDSFGEEHEFIVLQYWYFYAMNDWEAKGGLNNHEGDWESVFVFLDEDTEEPKYVAFSAHHNDGDSAWNLAQYGSVRREWTDDEIERYDTNVMSYVALGSHANYPKSGAYQVGLEYDETSGDGLSVNEDLFLEQVELNTNIEPMWLSYEGRWGADTTDIFDGNSGPQGPYFIDVSGHLRYHNPLAWAGIDKIEDIVTEEPATLFSFSGTGIQLNFGTFVPVGTYFLTAPYLETPKGTPPQGTQLLAPFWDIESDLENGTFNTQVRLPIDYESLGETDDASTLGAYWFNPDTEGWEKQESTVDETGSFVVFNTNHFSRYAIGVEDVLETTVVEEGEPETETASSNSTGTRVGNRGIVPQVKGTQTSQTDAEIAAYETLINLLQQVIIMYKEKRYLTHPEIQSVTNELQQIITPLTNHS